jgi:rSAM/selenodomain-associated transferase 1
VVAVTPADTCGEVRALVGDASVEVFAQGEGDLGDRMRSAMTRLFEEDAGAVVLLGSDVPEITPEVIGNAFDRLAAGSDRVVLGPADDGGYYLVGARYVPPIFDGVAWGSERVLAETLRLAGERACPVHLLERLGDVDTAADLRRVARSGRAPRTTAWARMHVRLE